MGSAVIPVLQVVCLVLVIVAIVYARKALGIMKEANEITEKVVRYMKITEKAVGYMKGIRTEMEGRFKEMEDTISALRRGTKKKGGKNVG